MGNKCDIIWYDSLDSTNNEALRKIDVIDNLSVIAAFCQTDGRGQRGNKWKSTPGENLTFTIVLKYSQEGLPPIAASRQFIISEITALSTALLLREEGIPAMIKWPNDIYVGDKKICGILIEHRVRGENLAFSIAGVGLNLNQTVFPEDIPNPVSMKLETGRDFSPKEMLEKFMEIFTDLTELAYRDGGAENIKNQYLDLLYRKDSLHSFTDCASGQVFHGIIKGISPTACLLVEVPGEGLREYSFKEISYII